MRARRRWATLASFFVETAAIGVFVLFPLIYTEALPRLHFTDTVPPPPGRPTAAGPKERVTRLAQVPEELRENPFQAPRVIPTGVDMRPDRKRPTQEAEVEPPCVICVVGGVPLDDRSRGASTLTTLLKPIGDLHPNIKPPSGTGLVRISRMQPSMLIARVEPKYPRMAVETRTQGPVVLTALIGRDGRIENLQAVSGHPLLIKAALDAVREWRYRPTILNGQPVEVETQITVNFRLGQ
jgi:protein TonB